MKNILCLVAALLFWAPATVSASTQLPVSYICIEVETGQTLLESNADIPRPPASMLKMMQMLLVEEGVMAGNWRYDMYIPVSRLAQSMGGTQVFIEAGEEYTLERLMMAIAVLSANDASVAVAEGLWGSVAECLLAMNARAAELGMTNTHFKSVNGLPPSDGVSFDQSSARDMATLGLEIIKYPRLLEWSSMTSYALRPNDTARPSTNRLLERMPGCDGLKTGYIRAAGFCLTATAKQNDIRLIAVVMGSDRDGRFTHTQSILEEGFTMVQRVTPVTPGAIIGKPIPVEKGLAPEVRLVAETAIETVVRNQDLEKLTLEITAPVALEAPVEAHLGKGSVRLLLEGRVLGETTLLTAASIERKRFKHRMREMLGMEP